ncbi:hypothetical protein SESBI_23811 [Sesbania bispinosa]|nr:hypothetical protein SESBI_23811 [Sesbania bispinosa]
MARSGVDEMCGGRGIACPKVTNKGTRDSFTSSTPLEKPTLQLPLTQCTGEKSSSRVPLGP